LLYIRESTYLQKNIFNRCFHTFKVRNEFEEEETKAKCRHYTFEREPFVLVSSSQFLHGGEFFQLITGPSDPTGKGRRLAGMNTWRDMWDCRSPERELALCLVITFRELALCPSHDI
jgi:hypothetical protein